jgi:hypothetical protein
MKWREPNPPDSSLPKSAKITVRFGRFARAIACAISSTAVVPDASSSAPL